MDIKLKYAIDTLNSFFSCILYDLYQLYQSQDKNEHVSVSLSSGVYLLFTIVCECYRMDNFVWDTDKHKFILMMSLFFF
jgi:hypothetical protein